MSKTEGELKNVHLFPTSEIYEANKGSIGENDIALVPDEGGILVGTDYSVYRTRGMAFMSSAPSSIPNGCSVGVYE